MTYEMVQSMLAQTWNDIVALLGDGLNAFETKLLALLRAWEADPSDETRGDAVLAMLEKDYPAVYELMIDAMAAGTPDVAFRSTTMAGKAPLGKRYLIVPVWYATDRYNSGGADPGERYNGDQGTLEFGRVEVSIPDDHDKGRLEKPSIFRLQFREDPEKHVVLLSLEEQDADAWKAELKEKLSGCLRRDVLLFLHGYNVSFELAARRAAQFAHDIEFQGIVVFYSWPSEGKTVRYTVDEENAIWTVDDFEIVLHTLLTEIGAEKVHAVAHSMGNRVLTEGIRRLDPAALPAGSATLREVVFAAPDVGAGTFRTFVTKCYTRAERFTLYTSNGDKALEASQKFHKYARAGDGGDGVVLATGLETIDASAVDQSFMGHSYFCENRTILQDMFNLIMMGQSASVPRYGLQERKTEKGKYWAIVP